MRVFYIIAGLLSLLASPASASVPDISDIASSLEARADAVSDNAPPAQVRCVALAVYYEARGESLRGQRAVASVVMNRVRSPRFPNTPCEVLYQRGQFSFIGRVALTPSGPLWVQALSIAREHVMGAPSVVPHLFFNSVRIRRNGLRIGNHVFF